jgi:hypothetical protein
MKSMLRMTTAFGSVLAMICAAGCSSSDPAGSGTPGARFAVSGVIFGEDTESTYVSLLPSLDVADIDYKKSLEVPGRASIAAYNGWLFVSGGESATITRYSIGEDGTFNEDGVLSFANYGFDPFYIDDWGNTFVSASKSYLTNSSSLTVVWDPTAMKIVKEIETPELDREAPLSIDGSPGIVRGNRLYRTFFWKDWDEYDTLPEQYLGVFDVEKDELLDLVPESRCPGLNNRVSQDEAGNLYFSNWVYNVTETLGKGAPKSCALTLKAGSDRFDDTWQLSFADLTGGREGAAFNYLADGKGFITVFYDENVTIDDETDLNELAQSANWKLWSVDLASETAAPLEGSDWLAGGYATVQEDNRTFVLIPSEDYAATAAQEIMSSGRSEPRFHIKGFSYQLLKLR